MKKSSPLKILIAASEGVPYSKTGGLADVIGALPGELSGLGMQVAVVLPRYRQTKLDKPKILIPSLTVSLGNTLHFPAIWTKKGKEDVEWFFVDYPPFFDRDSLYVGRDGTDYPDNPERYSLFSRCVLEIAKREFQPDVIHCHDWQAGLTPVLMKTAYASDPLLSGIPSIFTIHNIGYQGQFPTDALLKSGLSWDLFTKERLEFYGKVNFLKGALVYSDWITTVSRKYSQEIQTAEYGFGLEGVLQERTGRISGILNGVDYSEWDPSVDRLIAANYNPSNLAGKAVCKKDVMEQFGFKDKNSDWPLLGIVSRFAQQKGADLITAAAEQLLTRNVRLIALGSGEPVYEAMFRDLAKRYPDKVGVKIAYDNTLAHKIEAGADMFLMPSHYEPCGLNQIYSLRYGTVPVVRATGGLDDTIEEYNPNTGTGTGFKFSKVAAEDFLKALFKALSVYSDSAKWKLVMRNGMKKDFSWKNSAGQYLDLYRKLAQKKSASKTQ
ncbi:MAG: starch synthase [Acidobacteria bacterium RIFCSPLOWO2_12_FULL_54_10]|nr:MAG: starch synthase [Acidobacteria bacterium RIFCSPLOWO2_12_FULL_54_10]